MPADHRDGGRDVEPEGPQCRVLVDLAHLQFHDPPPIDDEPAVALQPAQDRPGVVLGCDVATCMRRSAHPRVEDTLWWYGVEVERTLDQVPLLPGHSLGVERLGEGRQPFGVLVDHEYLGHQRLHQSLVDFDS